MAYSLQVDQRTCIKCGRCVRVCPSKIFCMRPPENEVATQNVQMCIACGHCVAVCPTDSVLHSEFPPQKVHPIDRQNLPSSEQLLELIRARRSNRAFSKKPVPEQYLNLILEAAHRAPTASNMQGVEYTLITDPKVLLGVRQFTIDTFAALIKKLNNPIVKGILKPFISDLYRYIPAFAKLKEAHDKGVDLILRGGTALIFIHTPKESRYGCEDANLAYQNGSLMAESLGVSQVYTGFVLAATKQSKRLNEMLGIEGKIHAGMALGMPSFEYPNYIDKKEIKVKRY